MIRPRLSAWVSCILAHSALSHMSQREVEITPFIIVLIHFIYSKHLNPVWIQLLRWKLRIMHKALKHVDGLLANADAWNHPQWPSICILHTEVFSDRQSGISCKSGNLKNKESSVLRYLFAGGGHMICIKSQLLFCHKVYSPAWKWINLLESRTAPQVCFMNRHD